MSTRKKVILMLSLKYLIPGLMALTLSGCASLPLAAEAALPERAAAPAAVTLLTVITSDDPETQFMALTLTLNAKAAGAVPRILLCSAGGDLALNAPPASATSPLSPAGLSPQDLLKRLINEGAQTDVCAIYLPNRPFGAQALMEGVGVARPADIGGLVASPEIRLFSF